MAIWKITNYHKKNAVERQIWVKDGITIFKEEGFRWGVWTCESDEQPDIDLNNPDGYDLTNGDYDWEMEEMIDGSWVEWTFPNDMDEEEQERIQELWDENSFEGLEEEGWVNDETEHWIFGPIQLTNEDTGEEWQGKD
ncbi:hypothetical protein EBU71_06190 [bacterium]|nr:hypothetical protein [Candidatus Elulimicrobium humile]